MPSYQLIRRSALEPISAPVVTGRPRYPPAREGARGRTELAHRIELIKAQSGKTLAGTRQMAKLVLQPSRLG